MALAVRRAILGDHADRFLQHLSGEFLRVGNGSGGKNKLRMCAVKSTDPLEPPQHIGDVGAEHPAVSMNFIDHNKSQVAQKLHPQGVVR